MILDAILSQQAFGVQIVCLLPLAVMSKLNHLSYTTGQVRAASHRHYILVAELKNFLIGLT